MDVGELRSTLGRSVRRPVIVAVVAVAVVLSSGVGALRYLRMRAEARAAATARPPSLSVPLWVPPREVEHRSRFAFTYETAEAVADLRSGERLDAVVAGAQDAEDAARRLMTWTRAQWEPGRPDPYPPPDARIILRDIRAGRTGGFCAQYCAVLLQAIASFHGRARFVTIAGHEVIEAWLPNAERWTMLDPTYRTQVFGPKGVSLSVLEIRAAALAGAPVTVSPDNRLPEPVHAYLQRFRSPAFWLRNDLVRRPLNFSDIPRYRVWFDPPPGFAAGQPDALSTRFPVDLYP
jgi:hypothetical protein